MAKMYSLEDHGAMITDAARTDAYHHALQRAVRPGAVVVDIGCGSGIFSFLACQAGARRVYAVETSETIALAQELAAANGFADRIEFISKDSADFSPPEPADVVVSDVRGVMPHLGRSLASIIDARKRFLRPGGTLIPQRDTVWGALLASSKPYEDFLLPWRARYCIDFGPARRVALNSIHSVMLRPEQICCEPQRWCVLDYATLETPHTSATVTFDVEHAFTAFGCCFWFDTILSEGIGYTTAPGRPDSVYGLGFFPWLDPVNLAAGDRVSFELSAHLVGEGYIWSWKTEIFGESRGDSPKVTFQQSSFLGTPLAPKSLEKRCATYIPVLSKEGEMDRFLLERIDNHASLGEIARAFAERFPNECARWEDALNRTVRITQKYGR